MRRFSSTDRPWRISRPSGDWLMPRLEMAYACLLRMSSPWNKIWPEADFTTPEMVRMVVVFPAPLAPSTTTIFPWGMSMLTPFRARMMP